MRFKLLTLLAVAPAVLPAIDIPRKSPEFAVQLLDGKQVRVSDYRGKVLCLTFILTT